MTSTSRQNTLFVAEDWRLIYDQLSNVDFTALDFQSLRTNIYENIRANYPEDFNDWIGSSEFIIKMDTLIYLAQVLAYRFDLNARENYLTTAERRDSILKLAYNIAYSVSRVRGASGLVKVKSIRTSQQVLDLDDNPIRGDVIWGDTTDPDWYDKWLAVLNVALDVRSKWGRPIRKYSGTQDVSQLFRLNSPSPNNGVYAFIAKTPSGSNVSLDLEIYNGILDEETGAIQEEIPNRFSSFHLLYKNDGVGFNSTGTGFYLPIKQGAIESRIVEFQNPAPNSTISITSPNVGSDVWLAQIDDNNDVVSTWTKLDSLKNVSLGYQPESSDKTVYEVITKENDQITIRFGDGKFGKIPVGRFIVWYRTCSPTPYVIRPRDVSNQTISIPYVSDGNVYQLSLTFSLEEPISNAAASETADQIKERASALYATQNRMTSAADYNTFPLSDNSILKLKAVNRTFAGHGKSLPVNDPTGTYKNVIFTGTDGRLYRQISTDTERQTWRPATQSVSTFIADSISPGVATEEAALLYYAYYPLLTVDGVIWTKTDTVGTAAYGKINQPTTVYPLNQLNKNSLLRFQGGTLARLSEVVDNTNGTIDDSFRLKLDPGFDFDYLSGVLPAIRRAFDDEEKANISQYVISRRSFGLRWNAATSKWLIIRSENLDPTGDFSLANAGDAGNTNADASWFVHLEYVNQVGGEDQWDIHSRGLSLEFESAGEVEFFHSTRQKVVHPTTGRVVQDTLVLTTDNEAKNSLSRRSLKTTLVKDRLSGRELLTGDGSKTRFRTSLPVASADNVFITDTNGTILPRGDWALGSSQGLLEVIFVTAPDDGDFFYAAVDPRRVYLTPTRQTFVGNAEDTVYSLGAQFVAPENTFVFSGGLLKAPYHEYSTFQTAADTRVRMGAPAATDAPVVLYSLAGGDPCWSSITHAGDGVLDRFPLTMKTYFVMVFIDGVRTWDFTINDEVQNGDFVEFPTAPALNAVIHVRALYRSDLALVEETTATATADQTTINVPFDNASGSRLMVFIDGEYLSDMAYDDALDDVFLDTPLEGGEQIVLTHITVATSMSMSYSLVSNAEQDAIPELLKTEQSLLVYENLTHTDGYPNTRGLRVTNIDEDNSGDADDPFFFEQFVIADGSSDLVLWRQAVENGFDVWKPLSEDTVPRGTYHSPKYQYAEGDSLEGITIGSVHYDSRADQWLIATSETPSWIEASDQTVYRHRIGRDKLKFRWEHYADVDRTIDPSPSNIVDMFVLTKQYDTAVRDWVDSGTGDAPTPETGAQLRLAYGRMESFKTISDAIVWKPARYKFLFGAKADTAYRGKFLIIKAPGSILPDTDLKLRVLDVIDTFFNAALWDFGDSFYYTQLCAFIHQMLPSDIHSVVIVSDTGEEFGHLFQSRCQSDEIFISTATVADLEVVNTFTRDLLHRA